LGRGVAGLRPRSGSLEPKYLWHWLIANAHKLAKLGKGSTFTQISRADIEDLPLDLPDTIDQQRRIAAILDKADAIRRKRRQALVESDALLRTAYLELVGYKHFKYEIWPPVGIEELAAPHKGAMRTGPFGSDLRHSEFVDEGIAVLGIDNAVQNRFAWGERRFITEEKYERLRRYRVYPKDVIITIMGTTGRSAVIPKNIPEAITTKHLAAITPDQTKVLPEFLSYAMHSDPFVIEQIKRANKGAIMDGLNLGIIKALEIRLPPLPLQERFAACLSKIHKQQDKWSSPELSGEDLFSSLSQRAFRGEL
jgi:type I restriction enzyme S subunit